MNWHPDAASNPNHHAAFGGSMDTSMFLNPAQFQNQAFLNGAGRASPFNPVYQTNSVVPAKRAREDGFSSPRQAPGGLPGSRSQTPQGPFPGYNAQSNGVAISSAPAPFAAHLQTSSNPSPSPQLNHFNPSQGNQRVSPSPFSPHNASPAPPDHASRVATPHDNAPNFMPNGVFAPGFNQSQFPPNVGNGLSQMGMNTQVNMGSQHPGMAAAQRNYQLQLQAQARSMQAQAQARGMNGMSNNSAQQAPNPQMPQPSAFNAARPNNPEDFVRGLQSFMAARGRQVDLNPVICGRQLPLLRLYAGVVKSGGSQRISKLNQWGALAQQFGFPPPQIQQAAQELQSYWMNNLAPYEAAWQMSQQKQKMAAQAAIQGQTSHQMSPVRDQSQDLGHQRSASAAGPILQQAQQHAPTNGFAQPPAVQAQQDASSTPQHRSSVSRQFDAQQLAALQAQTQASTPPKRPQTGTSKMAEPEPDFSKPLSKPIEDPFKPDVLPPSRFHGPINVDEMFIIGQHIIESKPVVPTIRELGVIDIHALTMAIKSGMHAETRVALDTLVTLSMEVNLPLQLAECDDLVDTLIDCAQDQVNFLSEHATEVSDEMFLTSYEELVRSCRFENETLQDNVEFGTLLYDMEKASEKIVAITTILRNFSFYEANFNILGSAEVVKLLSTVIRYLGTTEMFLRQNRNTLDFMKDVVIYFSNLSTSLQLPGKEEARSVLHFLLAFAPTPSPTANSSGKVSFVGYKPGLHKYMPSAVDSLAKLLARDEPNRTYYKAIFAADSHANTPYELLTRTFGLAISPIPGNSNHMRTIIEARKPYLLQGMLAAEILASLAPSSDHPLARSWLESDDGFAGNLLRLVGLLSADRSTQTAPRQSNNRNHHPPEADANGYGAIANRAMAVLKTLVQKARRTDEHGSTIVPLGIMPSKESLLGAMIQKDIDPGILRQLCVYAGLED